MYEPRHIPASHRLSAWLLSALFALSLCVQQAWAAPAERTVIPLGQAVGIKLFADGVLVVSLADGPTPARACGLRQGDIITAMDGTWYTHASILIYCIPISDNRSKPA